MRKSFLAIGALSLILFGGGDADAGKMSKAGRSVGNKQSTRSSSKASNRSRGSDRASDRDSNRATRRGQRTTRRRGSVRNGRSRIGFRSGLAYPGNWGWGGMFYPSPFYYGFQSRYCATCPSYPPSTRSTVQNQLMASMKLELGLQSNKKEDQFTEDAFATHVGFSVGGPYIGIRLNHDQYNETVFSEDYSLSETNNVGLWGAVITGRVLQAPQYLVELEGGLGGMHSNLFDSMEGLKVGASIKFRPNRNVEIIGRGSHYYFAPSATNTGSKITVNEAEVAVHMSYFKVGYRMTHFNFNDERDITIKDADDLNFSKGGPEVGLSLNF